MLIDNFNQKYISMIIPEQEAIDIIELILNEFDIVIKYELTTDKKQLSKYFDKILNILEKINRCKELNYYTDEFNNDFNNKYIDKLTELGVKAGVINLI